MVPIHDTDVAEERFAQAEWNHYELWEKIEVKLRRKRWLWVLGTAALFMALSSVPVIMSRYPKWVSMRMTRQLAQRMNWLRKEAGIRHRAFRIRFAEGSMDYQVEQLETCRDSASPAEVVERGTLGFVGESADYVLLSKQEGDALNVPGLIREFCYDPISGSDVAGAKGDGLMGFGVMPVKDLTEKRIDHLSLLLLKGSSAEASFE